MVLQQNAGQRCNNGGETTGDQKCYVIKDKDTRVCTRVVFDEKEERLYSDSKVNHALGQMESPAGYEVG